MAEHRYLAGNALVCGDNYAALRELPDECIDLVYLDPPFNSNQFYVAAFGDKGMVASQLRDIWRWTVESQNAFDRLPHGQLRDSLRGIRLQAGEKSPMAAYAVFMGVRLAEMRRVLKPSGSVYLHCDPHANAYLRVLMDGVFGENQFRNEVAWCYSGPSNTTRWFPRKHDTILFYAKSNAARFNRDAVRIPYSDSFNKRRQYTEGKRGITAGYSDGRSGDEVESSFGKGKIVEDWWSDIPSGGQISKGERTGYPTQKPVALLERVIKASSNQGDLVLDPFCGCGTAADAAASLGRKYLGIDISGIAVRLMQQRLESRGDVAAPVVYGLTWDEFEWEAFERRALAQRDDVEDGIPGWAWAEDRVAALLNAVPNERKVGDGGVDARYFGAMDVERKEGVIIPIQVKMHRASSVGRPDMDRLLGVQARMNNRGLHAPMSIMVSLYPPPESLRVFAAEQHDAGGGRGGLSGDASVERRGDAASRRAPETPAGRPALAGGRHAGSDADLVRGATAARRTSEGAEGTAAASPWAACPACRERGCSC